MKLSIAGFLMIIVCLTPTHGQSDSMIAQGYGFQSPINNIAQGASNLKLHLNNGIVVSIPRQVVERYKEEQENTKKKHAFQQQGNNMYASRSRQHTPYQQHFRQRNNMRDSRNRERTSSYKQHSRNSDQQSMEEIQKYNEPKFEKSAINKFLDSSKVVLLEGLLIPRCERLLLSNTDGVNIFQRYFAASLCDKYAFGLLRRLENLGGARELVLD